jgi:hypothetical protein
MIEPRISECVFVPQRPPHRNKSGEMLQLWGIFVADKVKLPTNNGQIKEVLW